ncbi:MAG: CARDB domain-containing protein [Acidobacteriota bacterium]
MTTTLPPAISTRTGATVAACALLVSVAAGGTAEAPRATAPPAAASRPDLVVRLEAPPSARAGEELGERARLVVRNLGSAVAPGTRGNATGFMIDLTLGRDTILSVGFKAYSPRFSEDVLLEGGRVSKTDDLSPSKAVRYPVGAVVPADTPAGRYFLCAFVDPGNVVPESNEANNSTCVALRITPADRVNDGESRGKGADARPPERSTPAAVETRAGARP